MVYDMYIYIWIWIWRIRRILRIRHASACRLTGIGSVPGGAAMRLSKWPHGESAVAILGCHGGSARDGYGYGWPWHDP